MKLTGGDVNDEEYEVVGDQKVADAVFETFKEKFLSFDFIILPSLTIVSFIMIS